MKEKKVKYSYDAKERHWVGDGFFVHGLLRPSEELNKYINPFLLIDYASPMEFTPTKLRRGVGEHPHRGFETVTLAYQGEVEHKDSSGGGGVIRAGDIQWMTAGRGVVHSEFHSDAFSKSGGIFEMVQLWINLPRKDKLTSPKYQEIQSNKVPSLLLGESTNLRVISGNYHNVSGPAQSFTSINMFDLSSLNEDSIELSVGKNTNTILLIMAGRVDLDGIKYGEQSVLIFDHPGELIRLKVSKGFKALFLNGESFDEPIVTHGPFVMNTREEIGQAIKDYQDGKMGHL